MSKQVKAIVSVVLLLVAAGIFFGYALPSRAPGAGQAAEARCTQCDWHEQTTWDNVLVKLHAHNDAINGGWVLTCPKCGKQARAYRPGEEPASLPANATPPGERPRKAAP